MLVFRGYSLLLVGNKVYGIDTWRGKPKYQLNLGDRRLSPPPQCRFDWHPLSPGFLGTGAVATVDLACWLPALSDLLQGTAPTEQIELNHTGNSNYLMPIPS